MHSIKNIPRRKKKCIIIFIYIYIYKYNFFKYNIYIIYIYILHDNDIYMYYIYILNRCPVFKEFWCENQLCFSPFESHFRGSAIPKIMLWQIQRKGQLPNSLWCRVLSLSLSLPIAFRPSLFTIPHISLALAVWVSSIAGKKPHPQPCLLVPLFAKGIISERFALLCLNVASKNIT